MHRILRTFLFALLGVCASTVLASAQTASSQTDINSSVPASSSPVAFVYVSNTPTNGSNQISGYTASPNGALTAIPGLPLVTPAADIVANGQFIFGSDGMNIDSFAIASNGALTQADSLSVEPGGGVFNLFLDHTGSSLYADYYTTNNEYLAYSIGANGALTYLDNVMGGPGIGATTSFVGSNEFSYASSCYHFTPSIYGLQRSDDGSITLLNMTPPYPATPTGYYFYCPWQGGAADPTDHIAFAMQLLNGNWAPVGPYQLATYTADGSGNLTTTSTYSNMPSVLVGVVNNYWMSPTGKFLAVAGSTGLQVFHFNGANPITKYTGKLVSEDVDQVLWDNANHLYALGRVAGKLWVFTVTSTGVKQAPGSPYTITGADYLVVLPNL
jgi:hypothetical protein